MKIVAKVGIALQEIFGKLAQEAAQQTKVILRQRKFNAVSLAQTFVLGFLQNPKASDDQLAQMAVQCGAEVTPQAVDQRHTPRMVAFLEGLFRQAVTLVVGSDQALAPVLERFPAVTVLDSSTITLPESMKERFPGCGGSHGQGKAALKLQTEIDLRGGALSHVEIEPGRRPDSATCRQQADHYLPGSLRITDLGYFNLAVFASMVLRRALSVAFAVWRGSQATRWPRGRRHSSVAVGAAGADRRSMGFAGQNRPTAESADCLALAGGTSESASSKIAGGDLCSAAKNRRPSGWRGATGRSW